MKTYLIIGLILFLIPFSIALNITPETITINQFGGECTQIPFTINNPHETDLPAYLYYTTDLEDTKGLTLKAENPFIAKQGNTTIPLQVCTTTNFAPSSFNVTLYADANIEHTIQTITRTEYIGGGTAYTYVYKDKNIYVDKNIVVQIPKEIIKEKIVEKRIEVPVEKIVEKVVTVQIPGENKASGLFGLVQLSLFEIAGIIAGICAIGLIIYFMFIKPKEVN